MKNGNIVGFKYFGFGGLDKDTKGLKSFEGAKKGNKTAFNLFITPKTTKSFKVQFCWCPWDNALERKENWGDCRSCQFKQETTKFSIDVAKFVKGWGKSTCILSGPKEQIRNLLFGFYWFGFSSVKKPIERSLAPRVSIFANG